MSDEVLLLHLAVTPLQSAPPAAAAAQRGYRHSLQFAYSIYHVYSSFLQSEDCGLHLPT